MSIERQQNKMRDKVLLQQQKEREIEAFNPEEYWTITSVFDEFEANLFKYKNYKISTSGQPSVKTKSNTPAKYSGIFSIVNVTTSYK